jgi:hypothetical protein
LLTGLVKKKEDLNANNQDVLRKHQMLKSAAMLDIFSLIRKNGC